MRSHYRSVHSAVIWADQHESVISLTVVLRLLLRSLHTNHVQATHSSDLKRHSTFPYYTMAATPADTPAPTRPSTDQLHEKDSGDWLTSLDTKATEKFGSTGAWICEKPITFVDQKMKETQEQYGYEGHNLLHMSRIAKVSHHGARTWVVFCVTPLKTFVGKTLTAEQKEEGMKQFDIGDNHAFAAAVVSAKKHGNGKHIYIFDCDQAVPQEPMTMRVRDLHTQRARKLVEVLSTGKGVDRDAKVFVGNRGEQYGDKGRCVDETTRWIEQIANADGVSIEEDSTRFEGFVQIKW